MNPLAVATPLVQRRTWMRTGYLLLSVLTGTLWFIILPTLIAFGVGTLLIWVGAVILAALPLLWRYGARAERRLVSVLLGVRIDSPYRPIPRGSVFTRARVVAADPATWKDLAYLLVLFPVGTLWCALVSAFWGWGLTLLTAPGYFYALPEERIWWLGLDRIAPPIDSWPRAVAACAVGAVLTVAAPYVVRGLGHLHGLLARGLLGATSGQVIANEAARLRHSRDRAVEAAATERRRVERDLHDGAQQRLISVAMNLGLARQKLATDPNGADELLRSAHADAKHAIAELRDIARGLRPAMLAELGLDAALSALAGRSPVPVEVDVAVDLRPPEAIEEAAYFLVAEALTNIAKHARAERAWVHISRESGRLRIEVGDDGTGGASSVTGGGLAGLSDRFAGLDGTIDVMSPPGGPTVIRAELPCGS